MQELAARRASELEKLKDIRKHERRLEDRARKRETLVDFLGARLARAPEGSLAADELTRIFHMECSRHRADLTKLTKKTKALS